MRYLLALLLLVGSASALDFGKLNVEKGYAGPLVVDVTLDGVAYDVTGASATLTVYSVPPSGGVGGTVLFTRALTPAGTPTNRLACVLAATDTATPGTYYAELAVTVGATVDTAHGTVVVTGR